MAVINKYKISDDGKNFEASISDTVHSSLKDGLDYGYIDFEKATKGELLAFRQGWVDRIVNEKNFVQTNPNNTEHMYAGDDRNYNSDGFNSQSMNQSKQAEKGKTLTLSNGHSILGNDRDYPNGFSDRLLISLLAGFGFGVVAATVYIFTNLSKVTISLQ